MGANELGMGEQIAARVEAFVRAEVMPYESDQRAHGGHGPSDELVAELREKARKAGVLTPHIGAGGTHRSHRDVATVLRRAGLSPLGPLAVNVMAPDEGNMYLLGKVASPEQKARFLQPLIDGASRSAFLMTEPAAEGGAGSDPSMMKTVAQRDGGYWVINGKKAFITGIKGASVGILMARTDTGGDKMGATLFLVDLPNPAIRIERLIDTIDSASPGGHAVVTIDSLRVSDGQILGAVHEGFRYAQVRLAPARLTHCSRWLGAATRAQEIAIAYTTTRHAFGKLLIDHEGVGFMLAENQIALKQAELTIDWCAGVLDSGQLGTV